MIIGTILANNAHVPIGFVKSLIAVKEYTFITQEGPSIPTNRNEVFERARFENESLLFIDSDMVFTPTDVKTIEKHLESKDIVTGVYAMGFPGFPPALFKKFGGVYKLAEPEKELFELDGCGAGFLGISKKVIKTLLEPFTLMQDEKSGQFYGEDISFCLRAQRENFKIWCDPSVKLGHIKTHIKYYDR